MSSTQENIPVLKPLQVARISEISESTASAQVPDVRRVSFHIGNPVQDIRLEAGILDLLAGEENPTAHPLWTTIAKAAACSVPYAPRGGYRSHKIPEITRLIHEHLLETEREGLEYNLGENGEPRELIFCTGGPFETLRVLLRVLNTSLEIDGSRIISLDFDLSRLSKDFDRLRFTDEYGLREDLFTQDKTPVFFVLGRILSETERKKMRQTALDNPVMFIEINDAPNHLSMAREAGLRDHVIRFLSPSVFRPELGFLPVVTVLGNAVYLQQLETVHFELKGTPSASELFAMEAYLSGKAESANIHSDSMAYSNAFVQTIPENGNPAFKTAADIFSRVSELSQKIINSSYAGMKQSVSDPLASFNREELLDLYKSFTNNSERIQDLETSFLASFIKSYPFYKQKECCVVSGSARTALGILGYHAGITDVIISDMSWNYEHTFPVCRPVPPLPDLRPDVDAIIKKVDKCLYEDPLWKEKGAVVVNTPHNATGLVWKQTDLEHLIRELTNRRVRIIDDLSYYGIAPVNFYKPEPSIRQCALSLRDRGVISADGPDLIITVHSLSKTDCLAGARLAVAHIPQKPTRQRFMALNEKILPNPTALLIGLLFYRNSQNRIEEVRVLRNKILNERMTALETAENELPDFRNPGHIRIHRPEGAMYPRLEIRDLPEGVSIDLLAAELANQGIGLIPLTSFARTSYGFTAASKSFRLSLGGADSADDLRFKTRRMLIDLNRIVRFKEASVRRVSLPKPQIRKTVPNDYLPVWEKYCGIIREISLKKSEQIIRKRGLQVCGISGYQAFMEERIRDFTRQFEDACQLNQARMLWIRSEKSQTIAGQLLKEFYKEEESDRVERFKFRMFDRTVHPTQIHALPVERAFRLLIELISNGEAIPKELPAKISKELTHEFLGENTAISSADEAFELILDIQAWQNAEEWAQINYGVDTPPLLLSFWSDWDGSSRPSGQGHRLAASILLYDVQRMADLLLHARKIDPSFIPDDDLLKKVLKLSDTNKNFWKLLNRITDLTVELAARYQSLMPYDLMNPSSFKKVLGKVGLAGDPVRKIWQHNDKLERQMKKLREERRFWLEYYFTLNKALRKTIHGFIPSIAGRLDDPAVAMPFVKYRSAVKRVALTPRIHQKQILDRDQFAIDTTVFNICEINSLAQKTGHPRMVPALQVSMSDTPRAFVNLDRKFLQQRETLNRKTGDQIPPVWIIPLFEEMERVKSINQYLDEIWSYALRTRRVEQSEQDRFKEMICEFFIAGSDLSQQVGQPGSQVLYQRARVDIKEWLATRGLAADVRVKLGSGEPMQRQGGYYDPLAGKPVCTNEGLRHFPEGPLKRQLNSARFYLRGIWQGWEFRTFQSTVSEQIRFLDIGERTGLLYHLILSSAVHAGQVRRMNDTFQGTRNRSVMQRRQMIESLYGYSPDEAMDHFIHIHTQNFRQILYGRQEDLTGLHLVSYFLSRIVPTLRDRPTIRPVSPQEGGELLQRFARIIPMSDSGSMLRAIGHQRSQTVMTGVNQLSTGLFRAMRQFAEDSRWKGEGYNILQDRVLCQLPCIDILKTLRLYHDPEQQIIKEASAAFPPGNSAFAALEEDIQLIRDFIPLLQSEILRSFGLPVQDIMKNGKIDPKVLYAFTPELAVLLQPGLFNHHKDEFVAYLEQVPSASWIEKVFLELEKPQQIAIHRNAIWDIVSESVLEKIYSFNELAFALNVLAGIFPDGGIDIPAAGSVGTLFRQVVKMPAAQDDDRLKMLLLEAVRMLRHVAVRNTEIPVDVLRVIRDVQQIIKLEETALKPASRNLIQAHLLAVARLTGENG